MTDQSLQFPRFYVTAAAPCPYLPDREERKVFTELKGKDAAALNESLSRVGFRRSQSVAYRPACEACSSCISVRVPVRDFVANRRMRRILTRNRDLVAGRRVPVVRQEHYELLTRYLADRHSEGGMADMDIHEFADMVENSPVETMLVEYRTREDSGEPGRLVGVALSDILGDGISMVYSFFEPSEARRSPGTFMILEHIERAARAGLGHVYLGYWIAESRKMAYKGEFRPLERLGPEGWHRFAPESKPGNTHHG